MQVQFHLLDLNYKIKNNKTEVYLFGRTKERQICVIEEFEPYFYVVPDTNDIDKLRKELEKIKIEKKGLTNEVTKTELLTKRFLGKELEVIKVYCNVPNAELNIRDEIKNNEEIKDILEYDIPFVQRYLIDKNIIPLAELEAEGEYINQKSRVSVFKAKEVKQLSDEMIKPRILAFDIETYSQNIGREILMIAFYADDFEKVITWKKTENSEFVNDEKQLLEKFKEIINDYKPDILTGYFSDGFDFPYLQSRADKYNVNLDLGLDYSEIRFGRGKNITAQINGIIHLDIFKFIRKVIARTLDTESYKLDNVASELLNEGKKKVDLDKLPESWDNGKDLEKYCEYNLHDAKLTFKLAEKMMPNIVELVKIVGMPIFDVNRMSFSQLVESYLIKQTPNFNELIPKKPSHDEIGQRRIQSYKGAFVFEPKPGLYKDIVVFDFRSLYPTIISSHNIGLDTLNVDCEDEKKEYTPDKKYYFCREKKSFISTIIEDLITRRMRIKEIMKNEENIFLKARSESLKILANAFYGYFAFFGARWYSIECARSITAYGRYYIQKVINDAGENGFNVIYSDTDSVFLTLDGKEKEQSIKFADVINAELPGLMELEYDGFYPRGIFVFAKLGQYGAKKRYALLNEKGSLKIVGFETIRRNVSSIAKDTQEQALNIILKENDKEKAVKYVQDIIQKLREKKITKDQVIIHTQLQKDITSYDQAGPHVVVAIRMQQKGINVGMGTLIKYIVVQGNEIVSKRSKIPEEVEEGEYDPEYYINNQVIPSVERIFNVLGYSKEELIESKEQSKLGSFF